MTLWIRVRQHVQLKDPVPLSQLVLLQKVILHRTLKRIVFHSTENKVGISIQLISRKSTFTLSLSLTPNVIIIIGVSLHVEHIQTTHHLHALHGKPPITATG